MKLIQRKNYSLMRWKNGLGLTEEIEASPLGYRISAAQINGPCIFSDYPGQKRLLTVWSGAGLTLNSHDLKKGQIHSFDGDTQVMCENQSEQVIDVGIIFDPVKVAAEMEIKKYAASTKINLLPAIHYFFCAKGQFQVKELSVEEGDTLKIENGDALELGLQSEIELFHISIKKRP